MDPISRADRLVMLLRQKLQERAKASGTKDAGGNTRSSGTALEPLGVRGLAAIDGADERQIRRAFVQNLLADQLGPALVNDAKFQQLVSRVAEAIEDDADTSALLTRLVAGLRPA